MTSHVSKNYEDTKSCFQHMRRGLATFNMHILERQDTVNKVILKKWDFEMGPDLAQTIYSSFIVLFPLYHLLKPYFPIIEEGGISS